MPSMYEQHVLNHLNNPKSTEIVLNSSMYSLELLQQESLNIYSGDHWLFSSKNSRYPKLHELRRDAYRAGVEDGLRQSQRILEDFQSTIHKIVQKREQPSYKDLQAELAAARQELAQLKDQKES